jgi:hypothetical protein
MTSEGEIVTFSDLFGNAALGDMSAEPSAPPLDSVVVPPEVAMEWKVFRYDRPSPMRTREWSHMFIIIAPMVMLVSLAISVSSSVSAAMSADASDGSRVRAIGAAGSSAVGFGVSSAMLMFFASIVAFVASQHAKASEWILPYTTMAYLSLAAIAELLLIASAISAAVESGRNPDMATNMTVLCILDAAVAIPMLLASGIAVTVSMFMRHVFSSCCDDDQVP